MSVVPVKLRTTTSSGTAILVSATLEYAQGRIFFVKSPYSLKDEIKAMRGSRWHGYDEEDPRKIWSVEDCARNRFQLSFLMGEDVFAWFDRPQIQHEYTRPLKDHQKDLTNNGLTYHYHIFAAEMGTGKTLSAQEVIERSGVPWWFWIGPKTSLPNIKREFRIWNFPFDQFNVEFFTYEGLKIWVDQWKPGDPFPAGMICDESSRAKNSGAQRSQACQRLADMIREKYGLEHGFVIEMSGTPSPKSPVDWWNQCEIAWPGFLREGSAKAMEERMAFMALKQVDQGAFRKRTGWKDDIRKCAVCGLKSPKLQRCSECIKHRVEVLYCSAQCQKEGWATHKKVCMKNASQERISKIENVIAAVWEVKKNGSCSSASLKEAAAA